MGTVSIVSDAEKHPCRHHDRFLVNGSVDNLASLSPAALRQNDPSKPWVVAKFGGTSVGKVPEVIAEDIVKAGLDKSRVVAVCSARSSDTKSACTTNR